MALDVHDLTEIIGNLLDNAARHGRTAVALTSCLKGNHVRIAIDNDGAGIPLEQREVAMTSGIRLDESLSGYGFGLTIVRDLLALHDGSLELNVSTMGGLRALVAVPPAR